MGECHGLKADKSVLGRSCSVHPRASKRNPCNPFTYYVHWSTYGTKRVPCQVRAILQPWADAAAAGRLPSDGPMGRRLRALLAGAAVLPTLVGGWASAAGGLLLNDRPDLARHFGQQQGACKADLEGKDNAIQLNPDGVDVDAIGVAKSSGIAAALPF